MWRSQVRIPQWEAPGIKPHNPHSGPAGPRGAGITAMAHQFPLDPAAVAQMAMELAIRASATPRLSLPTTSSISSTPRASSRPQFRPTSVSLPASMTTSISLLTLFTPPHEAKALSLPKDQMVSSLTEVEKTIDQPGIEVAVPIVRQAGEQALKIASPAISEASKKAQEAIQSSGFDTQPVLSAAKTVTDAAQQTTKIIEEAKPIASSTVETISSAEPVVIVGTAGALFLAYLLLPPIWSVISYSLRGYKEKEKDKAGIPRLPSSAKNRMITIPLEELPSKLKGLVRNVKKVEAEITALKISYLKKINKGSNIVILDSWIVADGFSGSRGWLQSRLGTDSYKFLFGGGHLTIPSHPRCSQTFWYNQLKWAKITSWG
uniref:Uncharacterized protein n=1 Tax=Fagus sylvatica TaxID=28930 RepID=A0A2N9F3M1_FAGSY